LALKPAKIAMEKHSYEAESLKASIQNAIKMLVVPEEVSEEKDSRGQTNAPNREAGR